MNLFAYRQCCHYSCSLTGDLISFGIFCERVPKQRVLSLCWFICPSVVKYPHQICGSRLEWRWFERTRQAVYVKSQLLCAYASPLSPWNGSMLHTMRVCGPCTVLYCMWRARLYNIFPHCLKNGTIFGKKYLNTPYVLIFYTSFVWNTYHSKKNWGRYYHKWGPP